MNRTSNNTPKRFLLLLVFLGMNALAAQPSRIWSANTENRVEATFEKTLLGGVLVRDSNGKSHLIRKEQLSKADLNYIYHHVPPKITTDVDTETRDLPRNQYSQAGDTTTMYTFTIEIKRKGEFPYKGQLTAELFVIGRERVVDNDSRFVLMSWDNQKLLFSEEGICEYSFPEVPFHAYRAHWILAGEAVMERGKEYLGWILVVYDADGNPISTDSNITVDWLEDDLPHTIGKLRELYKEHPGHFEDRHFNQSFKRLEPPRIPWFRRNPSN